MSLVLRDDLFMQMNNYHWGKLTTFYVKNFSDELEGCEKIRTMIYDKFEKFTKKYFYCQIVWYFSAFIVPHFWCVFGNLDGTPAKIALLIAYTG